jgi:alkylation response protein AidB-like acyl-CoA dehydrogenase
MIRPTVAFGFFLGSGHHSPGADNIGSLRRCRADANRYSQRRKQFERRFKNNPVQSHFPSDPRRSQG